MDEFLSIEDAAQVLGVEYKTVYRLVRDGQLPAGRIGRVYRIRKSDLDAFFERSKSVGIKGGERPLVPLEGKRCCVTGKRIVSDLDIGGYAQDTGEPICKAAWDAGARRSVKPDEPSVP